MTLTGTSQFGVLNCFPKSKSSSGRSSKMPYPQERIYRSGVWNLAPWSSTLNAAATTSFGSEIQISRLRVNLPPVGSPTNLLPWIAWTIWTARNLLIFENRTINPATCMTRAISAAKEWAIAQTLSPPPLSRPFGQFPLASNEPNPTVFCYTDASWIASTKHAGLAWIFTDRAKKELNRGSHFRNLISSPLLAESLAIRASLLHASALGYTNIWIHSDSQELVRALWTAVGHRLSIFIFQLLSLLLYFPFRQWVS
ncbi:hypothetical protein F2Q69_00012816 [Brassica cretica]|uniref:RNase H type-1 domain-containing protein n=1 Tax=Brassica cretica TaxID=69181 RepID=A0A8S9R2S7_BRACR|nr:hypothetical protein F2Q69_00012816 [Brassica cretica]